MQTVQTIADSHPRPVKERWHPLRAGLTNLFHYDREEFRFRDGRLLLRGNNGTGKSKVLALTLPFLLDGQLTPARVEPDGDPGKRMEWNLLLGGRHSERLGYSWIEFGRLGENGAPEFFTVGCGLRAVAGQGSPATWFFATPLRLGADFHLVGAGGFPLNRDRLADLLGDSHVFDTARRYRRAVDEKLFHLGEERYGALVDLLIQLRQPQLSKRPDPRALSAALTEALPPFDRTVLADVAEALRSLEEERQELTGLREAGEAVDAFRRHYRGYARIAARRRAREVRQAQSRYEKTGGELSGGREQLEEKHREIAEVAERIDAAARKLEGVRAAERTLRESPEMRSAEALHEAERGAAEREKLAGQSRTLARQAEETAERAEARLEGIDARVARGRRELLGRSEALEEVAGRAGLAERHRTLAAPLRLPDGPQDASTTAPLLERAERESQRLCRHRREGIAHLEELNGALDEAQRRSQEARRQVQDRAAVRDRLAEERAEAEAQAASRGEDLVRETLRHLAEGRELRLPHPETVAAALEEWVRTLAGDNPALAAAEETYRRGSRSLARLQGEAEGERDALGAQVEERKAERRRLEGGEHPRPRPLPTRDEAGRTDRPGAPFWQLLDFRPEVPPDERAGIEAALEGAGLLDAWVTPGGKILGPDVLDAALTPHSPAPRSLEEVLVPCIDPGDIRVGSVAKDAVAAVLRGIGWGESDHPAWISPRGEWRLGPARGRWRKESAVFLGHGAREEGRRRRLAELAAEIGELERRREGAEETLRQIEERRRTLDRERGAFPSDAVLRDAHRSLVEIGRRLGEQEEQCRQAEAEAERRGRTAQEALRRRDETAADLHLPADPAELRETAAALEEYARGLAAFWPTLRGHWQSLEEWHGARRELVIARERAAEAAARTREADEGAREAAVRRDTLRETVGESVAELERRLAKAGEEIKALEGEKDGLGSRRVALAGDEGTLLQKIDGLASDLERLDGERRQAVRALQSFAEAGLLGAATPELEIPARGGEWAADPAVRLARRVEQALEEVDDGEAAWNRFQSRLQEQLTILQSALSRHGYEAAGDQTDSGLVVWITFQSRRLSPDALAEALAGELEERQRLLDERERELLENHLISEVARQLQELITSADAQKERMNRELENRPTSTGMKLRLQWRPLADGESPEAPNGLAEARRRLLRQVVDAWSADDREAVGGFLQEHIRSVRAADEGGTLLEHLERALDYRHWHRFVVERWQDGQWRPASGPASGGERVLAVTIPLFAAASAHYGSASPHAPRLVLLDEAFAGVDDDSRAKCLGLLTQFDLDVVMTSEREWGCYPEVPGLAIHQLTRREGIDAVHVSHWEWDGRRRERVEYELPPLLPPEEAQGEEETIGSLF